jgi:hypothetical protein
MEKSTKILIGLAAAGVVAYFVFKKPKVNIGNLAIDFSSQGEKDAFYDAYSKQFGNVYIAPSGSQIETSYGRYASINTCMDDSCTITKPTWSKVELLATNDNYGGDSNGGGVSKALDEINKYFKSQVAPTNGKCPNGYYKETIYCIKAPCPEGMCIPYPELT